MTTDIKAAPTALLGELDFQALAREKVRAAVRFTLMTVLEKSAPSWEPTGTNAMTPGAISGMGATRAI
jgi:hypothetical protein